MVKILRRKELIDLNEAYQKALIWFFSFPDRELGLSELAEALKISKTTANRTVKKLEREGFLKVEELGRNWRISVNREHNFNYARKIGYNLAMIYESGIIGEIRRIVENPRAIILFGSYRKGDDNEKSDIDIGVEVLGDKELKIMELGVIPQFGYRRNVAVSLHIFSRKRTDPNLFSNMANGIVLDGFLEVVP